MTNAIFGLIGVFVGAALNGYVSHVLARRSKASAVSTSGRLLRDSFSSVRSLIAAVGAERIWAARIAEADIDQIGQDWNEHRATLAQELTPSEWLIVSTAAAHARDTRAIDIDHESVSIRHIQLTLASLDQCAQAAVAVLDRAERQSSRWRAEGAARELLDRLVEFTTVNNEALHEDLLAAKARLADPAT
jgi:hypothetical protein